MGTDQGRPYRVRIDSDGDGRIVLRRARQGDRGAMTIASEQMGPVLQWLRECAAEAREFERLDSAVLVDGQPQPR